MRWGLLAVGTLCLLWSGLDPLAKCGLALLAAWLEWRTVRSERTWHGSHWQLDSEGDWCWQRVDGAEGAATLEQATMLGPLMVLNLQHASGRIDLPIWPDQLDADTRRRMRVRLSHSNSPASNSAHS